MPKQKDTTEKKEVIAEPKKRATSRVTSGARLRPAKKDEPVVEAPVVLEDTDGYVPEVNFPEEDAEGKGKKSDRYFEDVGRRKTAVARVRLFTKVGDFRVNDKLHIDFFKTLEQQKIAEEALQKMKLFGRFRVSVKVMGGGPHAQAEAVRHGLARCLIKFNPDFRKRLKRATFLKRDPRMKERKKFGLKRARKAPRWAKR